MRNIVGLTVNDDFHKIREADIIEQASRQLGYTNSKAADLLNYTIKDIVKDVATKNNITNNGENLQRMRYAVLAACGDLKERHPATADMTIDKLYHGALNEKLAGAFERPRDL